MTGALQVHQRESDEVEKPTLLQRVKLEDVRGHVREAQNERWARERLGKRARDDAGNSEIINIVIGIAVFVALIPFIAGQITNGQANLTSFSGASALLGLVPLILIAVLVLRMWRGSGGRRRSGGI